MKNIFSIILVFFALSSFAQKATDTKDEVIITKDGTKLSIFVNDEKAEKFDILIYETFENVKVNVLATSQNPYIVDIKDWEPALYQIKIDYPLISQFRHYEVK